MCQHCGIVFSVYVLLMAEESCTSGLTMEDALACRDLCTHVSCLFALQFVLTSEALANFLKWRDIEEQHNWVEFISQGRQWCASCDLCVWFVHYVYSRSQALTFVATFMAIVYSTVAISLSSLKTPWCFHWNVLHLKLVHVLSFMKDLCYSLLFSDLTTLYIVSPYVCCVTMMHCCMSRHSSSQETTH